MDDANKRTKSQDTLDTEITTTTPEEQEQKVELRVLISNAEAGVVIGKGGSNVKHIREQTSTYISILRSEGDARERVMSIQGLVEGVVKGLCMIADLWAADTGNPDKEPQQPAEVKTDVGFKILVHKFLSGCLIGKGGMIARDISSVSGFRLKISPDMLEGSTEKVAFLSGPIASLPTALNKVVKQLADNPLRPNSSAIPYVPGMRVRGYPMPAPGRGDFRGYPGQARIYGQDATGAVPGYAAQGMDGGYGRADQFYAGYPQQTQERPTTTRDGGYQPQPGESVQRIAIPTICAGAVLGKGGRIIGDIKRQSGCSIRIADPEPSTPNERIVTVVGNPQGIQTAIYLIGNRVEMPQAPWRGDEHLQRR